MSIYKREGSDVWWTDLWHRGRRIRRTTGERDKERAQRFEDELAARLWEEKEAGRTLDDALSVWLNEQPRCMSDLRNLRLIRKAFGTRPLPLSEVTNAKCLDVLGDKKPANYNRIIAVVRSALNLAHQREWVGKPSIRRRKVAERSFNWLTRAQYAKLRLALPFHARAMADFAVSTGLRWQNVAYLEWSHVDFDARRALIRAEDIKDRTTIGIPLNNDAMAVLRAQHGKDEVFVFPYAGRPVLSIKTAWNSAVKRSGVPKVRFHDLRHTWASWHVQAGTPLAVLKELGGWASMDMVMKYAHLAPGAQDGYVDNVSFSAPKTDTVSDTVKTRRIAKS